ncbi:MAG: hypothetical protein II968_02530 [Selenomonadaceae bacterium]|nr:hypothetical protein [Selenomonadaceae bacterium]
MIRKFIAACVLILFVSSTTAFATDAPAVIRVTGSGVGPHNWDKHDSFYKTFARQAARMEALVKLAECIGGVYVSTEEDEITTNSKITTEVKPDDKVFKIIETNARQVGKVRFLEDGTCEVDMELILPDDWKK